MFLYTFWDFPETFEWKQLSMKLIYVVQSVGNERIAMDLFIHKDEPVEKFGCALSGYVSEREEQLQSVVTAKQAEWR